MVNNQNPNIADNYKLNLSLSEVNQILEALGNLPFAQVHQLIAKIQNQASSQLNAVNQESEPKE